MCGIAGIIDSKGQVIDITLLKKMADTLRHRGPDNEGFYLTPPRQRFKGPSAGLGHRRLSIIDLECGGQPLSNEDKTIWVILNGEIYNFQELRKELEDIGHTFRTKSDTEVIVHAYESFGEDCVKRLDGMFAFALWDEPRGRLILARDRVGKKPLLYAKIGEKFIFASEFRSLLAYPEIEVKVNPQAIHHYLNFLYIPAPLTAFEGIRKLLPGHILIYEKGEISIKKYWGLQFLPKIKISDGEAQERIFELLSRAVKARLVSDVPLGGLLSGGVDSSIIIALMSEISGRTIKTFSIGFQESDYDERPFARIVAKRFLTDHHEFVVKMDALEILPKLIEHFGEPFGDSSALPTYYLSKMTRQEVTVALNGDGGDEMFAGYLRYSGNRLAGYYHLLPKALREKFIERLARSLPQKADNRPGRPSLRRFLDSAGLPGYERYMRWVGFFTDDVLENFYPRSTDFMKELFLEARGLDSVDSCLYTDIHSYLPNDLLVKMDIASMANSLEVRSPFLDHHLMEFAARLPSQMKLRRLQTKYILKKTFEHLVPRDNLYRRKQGFGVPVGRWFRGEMKNFLKDIVLSSQAASRGYFRPGIIERMVKDHTEERKDYTQHLWGALILELWHRQFID